MSPRRALVLAPHTDDAELGCGGTIARLQREGTNVYVVAFSSAAESLPAHLPQETLVREFANAMDSLKVPAENTTVLGYPVRHFPAHRQAILEDLVRLRARWQPELVLLPASTDVHQDHQVIHAEGLRAFKGASVWGYELPWNDITFSSQALVRLERADLNAKWAALTHYRSQIDLRRPYFRQDLIESIARVRGVQIGAQFAEAFEVLRQVW